MYEFSPTHSDKSAELSFLYYTKWEEMLKLIQACSAYL